MKKWIIALALCSQAAIASEDAPPPNPAESCGSEIGYIELKYGGTGYPHMTLIDHNIHLSFESNPLALDMYIDHGDNRSIRLDLETLTRNDEIYRGFARSHQIKPKGCIDDASANCDVQDLRLEMEIISKSLRLSKNEDEAARQKKALKCATRMINEFGKRVTRELQRRKATTLIQGN